MKNGRCLLVTDDNPAYFSLVKKALEECCPEVCLEWAKDGTELLDYLEHNDHPDIILLDLNMPKKNGLEALEDIRAKPQFSHIPIVVLTTSDDESQILKAYRLGSNSYIKKPFTYSDLKNFLSAFGRYWFDVALLPPKDLPNAS